MTVYVEPRGVQVVMVTALLALSPPLPPRALVSGGLPNRYHPRMPSASGVVLSYKTALPDSVAFAYYLLLLLF